MPKMQSLKKTSPCSSANLFPGSQLDLTHRTQIRHFLTRKEHARCMETCGDCVRWCARRSFIITRRLRAFAHGNGIGRDQSCQIQKDSEPDKRAADYEKCHERKWMNAEQGQDLHQKSRGDQKAGPFDSCFNDARTREIRARGNTPPLRALIRVRSAGRTFSELAIGPLPLASEPWQEAQYAL